MAANHDREGLAGEGPHVRQQAMRTAAQTLGVLAAKRESPWTAVGNFLDCFYAARDDEKGALIAEPPESVSDFDTLRWAAFLAASVDWLAAQYALTAPEWIYRAEYVLPEPWFHYQSGPLRLSSLFLSPPPFKARNIFCGDRALDRV